uniref:hypothetical protein n=1 Tax=unclassified Bradyrhizobium TaxID=2631580 RepID=UPI0029164374
MVLGHDPHTGFVAGAKLNQANPPVAVDDEVSIFDGPRRFDRDIDPAGAVSSALRIGDRQRTLSLAAVGLSPKASHLLSTRYRSSVLAKRICELEELAPRMRPACVRISPGKEDECSQKPFIVTQ